MITVAILINGEPIMARSAVNVTDDEDADVCTYRVDTGEMVQHRSSDGAAALARMLLDTIREKL